MFEEFEVECEVCEDLDTCPLGDDCPIEIEIHKGNEHFYAPGIPFRSWSYVGDPRPKMH